jgi:23S rRNA 5-hydroxycytidine C2501 synthase
VAENRIFPARMDGLAEGKELYRNHDQAFLHRLEKNSPRRRIAVSQRLSETADGIALTAIDEDGTQVTCALACDKIPAQKPELARRTIEKQLGSLGETIFEAETIDIDLPEMLFLPLALLNQLRRQTIELLEAQREVERPRPTGGVIRNNAPFSFSVGARHPIPDGQGRCASPLPVQLDYRGNVLNHQAEAFYRRHGVKDIEPAAESGLDMHGRVVMTTKLCLKYELGACPKMGKPVNLYASLHLLDEEGNRLELRFDCAACQMEVILR